MSEKMKINEEMHLEKEWFEEASKQTPETLMEFISHIMNDYEHDYGTVCHAISACAIAAAWAANKMDGACGGITGFQAGFIMWDFIKQWEYPYNRCGLRIIDYDDMLYPQFEHKFDKVLTKETLEALREEADIRLHERDYAADSVIEHWKRIADGEIPFGYRVEEK